MAPSEQIRKLRTERLRLTQVEFAHVVGVDPMTVSRWERGEDNPRLSSIRQLAKVGRVPVSFFFEEDAA